MDFEKYPSIDGAEKDKTYNRFVDQYPLLQEEYCIVQEKLDGSNVQFYLDENEDMHVGKRSSFIDRNENFHGIWEVFDRYFPHLYALSHHLKTIHKANTVRLYGELFGPGVQNRIDYGNERRIVIFDAKIDDEYLSYEELLDCSSVENVPSDLVVCAYGVIKFKEMFNIDVDSLKSHYSPSGEYVEGVVIKPETPYVDKGSGKLIAMKIKSDRFSEKSQKASKNRSQDLSEKGQHLKNEFEALINENRLHSLFSKVGPIDTEDQIGQYIKWITEDAKEDFFKDWGEDFKMLDDKEKKKIFKGVGPIIVPHLKKNL